MTNQHILVFGAAGKTGLPIMSQAIDQGLHVTAFVRDPAKLTLEHERLQVIQGNIQDSVAVDRALSSADFAAVISSLGVYIKEPITPIADGTRNIIEAMEKHGPKRFIIVSSLGAGDSKGDGNLVARFIQKRFLKYVLLDKDWQERHIMKSHLDWTIIRPPQLTDEPDIHTDVLTWIGPHDRAKKVMWKVSRADVAAVCLRALKEKAHLREAIAMARLKS